MEGFADIGGNTLWYESAGAGPAVVLVHSDIADRRMWYDQIEPFLAHGRVVRYDRRGYGLSPLPPGPYSEAGDLDALLDVLGIERAALVGLSMGGATAIDFALTYPDKVTALIPVASGLGGYQWSETIQRYNAEEEAAVERDDM